METGYFKDTPSQPELKLDETSKAYLLETARWAKFLAIMGICFMALYLLAGIGIAAAIANMPELGTITKGFGASGVFLLYSLVAFIGIYPLYALLKYSIIIKRAINSTDQEMLNKALKFHRNYYRYNGMIMLIMIGLYALLFVVMLLVGGLANAAG
jgi:hypothetical protein